MIVNILEKLSDIEQENGMLGTIVGVLAIIVVTIFTGAMMWLLLNFWLDVVSWIVRVIINN
ncbi:MAG: hypothetical protein RR835_02315 [Peptostreptococcaceae bacterium]